MNKHATRYLKRNDEELEKLVKERQRGGHRTKKPREDVLLALKESEENEYVSGIGKFLRMYKASFCNDWKLIRPQQSCLI